MNEILLNDRYALVSEIGRGGMGIVYRGRDTLLERPVAVKLVSSSLLGQEGSRRLLREAQSAAKLNHPNVVSIYDAGVAEIAGREEPSTYVVMEYVEGSTLRDSRPADVDEIIMVTRQICLALAAAHSQGIIHRDLKPENVAISPSGQVKLMDFGLARMIGQSRLTKQGSLVGTLAYMAPELILGKPASPASDLYAVGVLLYELAAGRLPFDAELPVAILTQHLHSPVPPPTNYNPAVPGELEHLILKLLQKVPANRPSSANAVAELLAEVEGTRETAPLEVPDRSSALDRLVRGRLVGRENELARIQTVWEAAASGHPQMLLVSGEPGIGKTRLVEELKTMAEISDGLVLSATCYEDVNLPFAPVSTQIRSAIAQLDAIDLRPDLPSGLQALIPDVSLASPAGSQEEYLSSEVKQAQLYEGITEFFRGLAQSRPLLLIVDDLHFSDSGTLSALRSIYRGIQNGSLMIVATYRESELSFSQSFRHALREWNRERSATTMKLKPLSREQTGAMLSTLLVEEVSPVFLNEIYEETEGNPFFIEEVCKALVDGGKLTFENGHWKRTSSGRLEVPQGIRIAVEERLTRLTSTQEEVLYRAALLGKEFLYDMLRAICRQSEESLIEALEAAERLHLIEEQSAIYERERAIVDEISLPASMQQPSYSFTHSLIRSTIIGTKSTLRRQRIQREVALLLEEQFVELRPELAPLLARYFTEANELERALPYLLQTGDSARSIFAYEEATRAYQLAANIYEQAGEFRHAASTLLKLALIYHNTHQFVEAQSAYEMAFAFRSKTDLSERKEDRSLTDALYPLRMNIGEPITLDPSRMRDSLSGIIAEQQFSGLVTVDAEGAVAPLVAQSWRIIEDGKKYIFYLRHDVNWSDGTRLTAHDFEFGWIRTLSPAFGQQHASLLYDIRGAEAFNKGWTEDKTEVGVRAIDDYTLEVELESPTGYFLDLLVGPTASPLPRHALDIYGETWTELHNLVTCGPYQIEEWEKETKLILKRNPKYHGVFGGNVDKVILEVNQDAENLEQGYIADELDVLYLFTMEPNVLQRLRDRYTGEYFMAPALFTLYTGFNTSQPPFDDPLVRRAFAHASDKSHLANVILKGFFLPSTGGLVPPGMAGHSPDLARPFDPARAQEMLKEAGYPGGAGFPEIEYLAPESGAFPFTDLELISSWEEVLGVSINLHRLPFADFLRKVSTGAASIWRMVWTADYPDPDNFLRVGSWRISTQWQDPVFDELVDSAKQESSKDDRFRLYTRAEEILVQDCPIIPLVYGRYHMLLKPWVKHFPVIGMYVTTWKDVVISSHI